MDKPFECWICDGCLNVSKKDSACRHSFCDGDVKQVIDKHHYKKLVVANNQNVQIAKIFQKLLKEAEPILEEYHQKYQDESENAYVTQTEHKKVLKENLELKTQVAKLHKAAMKAASAPGINWLNEQLELSYAITEFDEFISG